MNFWSKIEKVCSDLLKVWFNLLKAMAALLVLFVFYGLFVYEGETPKTPEKPTTLGKPNPPKKPVTFVTRGDTPACLTEAALDEANKALIAQDAGWFRSLDECILTKAGLKVRYIARGISTSKIRIFTGDGDSELMWILSYGVMQAPD